MTYADREANRLKRVIEKITETIGSISAESVKIDDERLAANRRIEELETELKDRSMMREPLLTVTTMPKGMTPYEQISWLSAEVLKLMVESEPQWVVNSLGELGVKVQGRYYFLYKGESLEYDYDDDDIHDDGTPMRVRPVGKREFGEVCNPIDWSPQMSDKYTRGDGWVDITLTQKDEAS